MATSPPPTAGQTEEADADGVWMPYGRAADCLGIEAASVRRAARRHRWPRRTDNLGTVEVQVPHRALMQAGSAMDKPEDGMRTEGGQSAGGEALAAVFGKAVDALTEALAAERARLAAVGQERDQARQQAQQAAGERDAAEARARTAEQDRNQARAEHQAVAQRLAALEQADAAARTASLPRRVWRAIRRR